MSLFLVVSKQIVLCNMHLSLDYIDACAAAVTFNFATC